MIMTMMNTNSKIRIGYACKTMGVYGLDQRSCTKKTAYPDHLTEIIGHNLGVLGRTLRYNRKNGIELFRISSDLIPFGSSPVNDLAWPELFEEEFRRVREAALGMRLSMHPGQYTVLNSPNEDVVANAVKDLEYHARVLDCLGLNGEHKLILHIGGVYGDKEGAMARFVENYRRLSDGIKARLVIENDDKLYNVADVLAISRQTGAPVVFDNLHHEVNPPEETQSVGQWIDLCRNTWKHGDGRQKTHYAQQAAGKKPGAHSETIDLDPFLDYVQDLPALDIMLEVKDKNISALKAVNCLAPAMPRLEGEWARYKYTVLERSHRNYLEIRKLLKDKGACPTREFYALVDAAMDLEPDNAVSAAEHVWGYFKNKATEKEKERFLGLLREYMDHPAAPALGKTKKHLWRLAVKYQEAYLLNSYYFLY